MVDSIMGRLFDATTSSAASEAMRASFCDAMAVASGVCSPSGLVARVKDQAAQWVAGNMPVGGDAALAALLKGLGKVPATQVWLCLLVRVCMCCTCVHVCGQGFTCICGWCRQKLVRLEGVVDAPDLAEPRDPQQQEQHDRIAAATTEALATVANASNLLAVSRQHTENSLAASHTAPPPAWGPADGGAAESKGEADPPSVPPRAKPKAAAKQKGGVTAASKRFPGRKIVRVRRKRGKAADASSDASAAAGPSPAVAPAVPAPTTTEGQLLHLLNTFQAAVMSSTLSVDSAAARSVAAQLACSVCDEAMVLVEQARTKLPTAVGLPGEQDGGERRVLKALFDSIVGRLVPTMALWIDLVRGQSLGCVACLLCG